MAVFNGNKAFRQKRVLSQPVVPVPKTVKETLNVVKAYENGCFRLEPKKRNTLYDRAYLFEDVNYINKDKGEKRLFLSELMDFLNGMEVHFKISLCNSYQSLETFLSSVRNEKNRETYPEIAKGIRQWQEEGLKDMNPTVHTIRILTVTCRADNDTQAGIYFRALEPVLEEAFEGWGSRVEPLNAKERFRILQGIYRPGEEAADFGMQETLQDWKTDILPRSIESKSDYLIAGDTMMTVLAATQYRKSINADTVLQSFCNLQYPSFVTLDYEPVQQEVVNDKLVAIQINNERQISDELDQKRRNGQVIFSPSYSKKKKKEDIEAYMEQVDQDDEKGCFLNFLIVVTAPAKDKKEGLQILTERMEEVCAIGKKEGIRLEPCMFRQLKALSTALPIGGRQVDYMRFFLNSSLVVLQPYHAPDILEPGGKLLGINKTTKNFIYGNRKLLPNPHGIIIGYSGSGKSFFIKLTEISQTLLGTDDDILILDPQNEFESICEDYGGVYFDLTPKSGIYLNGFEVSQEIFQGTQKVKNEFVARQSEYAKSLCQAIMRNIDVTQEHDTVISRCTERMFAQVFSWKRLKKQPTLTWLREEIRKELEQTDNPHDEAIIRPIYNSLEEYTSGACDMFGHPTNIRFQNRLVGFGMCNVPENNWEPAMITVLHYLSGRMNDNKKLQRATHLIVDETQVVSKKPGSAKMLNNAIVTFRKFGGIVTLAMQNVVAALANEQMIEIFQNCSYKCFFDQGGVDAQSLAEIQPLIDKEYRFLSNGKPGEGILIWNKKVAMFSARISQDNVLYDAYTTNFHEEAQKAEDVKGSKESLERTRQVPEEEIEESVKWHAVSEAEEERMIRQLATFSPVSIGDVMELLKLPRERAELLCEHMAEKGVLRNCGGRYEAVR